MEYRTKATVEEGIVQDHHLLNGGQLIEYQPGNGTRYQLLFVEVRGPRAARELLSIPDGGWVITWMARHRSRCLVHSQNGFLHWNYVAEHFKTSKSDAVVLAELIGHVTGIKATTRAEALRSDLRVVGEDDADADAE